MSREKVGEKADSSDVAENVKRFLLKEVLIGTPWGGGNKNLLAPPGGCQ